jgi:Lar family restriction alleviation protein
MCDFNNPPGDTLQTVDSNEPGLNLWEPKRPWDVSTTEARACPHCGGEGLLDQEVIHPEDKEEGTQYWIRCRSCAATGGWSKTKAGAFRQWNMRV